MDGQGDHDGNKILERITFEGNVQISRIIIAIRSIFVNANRERISGTNYIEEYQLKLQDDIILEIAKRGLQGINKNGVSLNLKLDELISYASILVRKSENVPLYISEAIKKISNDIKNTGYLTIEMIEALPEGIGRIGKLILGFLNNEVKRSELILISYYLVSHYTKFPEEFLATLKDKFNIPEPLFVDKLPDKNSVTLHSWYRDLTDLIFSENYDELNKYNSLDEIENIKNAISSIISGNFFEEKGIKCLKNIFDTLEKNEALKNLWEPIKEFNDNLGGRVPYKYLIDALMLCLIISTSANHLIKEGSDNGFGFNIDKESISFDKLDLRSFPFYYKLIDFLFNTYINENMLNELERSSRPFYTVTILYISRFLTDPIAKVISDGLLRDPNKKNAFIDIYEKYAFSVYDEPFIEKYIIALFPFYSGIKDLKYDDSHYHGTKADILKKRGKYDEAIDELNIAIKLDPNNPTYYNNKGNALRKLNKFQEAIESALRALDLSPGNPDSLILYAEIKADLNSPEEGISKISESIA